MLSSDWGPTITSPVKYLRLSQRNKSRPKKYAQHTAESRCVWRHLQSLGSLWRRTEECLQEEASFAGNAHSAASFMWHYISSRLFFLLFLWREWFNTLWKEQRNDLQSEHTSFSRKASWDRLVIKQQHHRKWIQQSVGWVIIYYSYSL